MSLMRNHLRLVLDRTTGQLVRVDHFGDPAPLAGVSPHPTAAPERTRPVPVSPPQGQGVVLASVTEARP